MRKLEIKKEKFLNSLVFMLMGLDKLEVNVQTLFLIELIKESNGGYLVIDEKRQVIMDRMGIKKDYFDIMIRRLSYDDHVRREVGILYLHPKYRAVKECEGNFLICEKSLGG